MSKYTCRCIAPGCDECFETEANNKEMAVSKLLELSERHNYDSHVELPIVTEEKKMLLVMKSLKQLGK